MDTKSMERIIISIEKFKELCPKCAERAGKKFLSKGIALRTISVSKADYSWLMLKQDDRPPKDWWDRCVSSVGDKAEDPAALCGWIWYHKKEGDEEALVTDESIASAKTGMKNDECIGKLKKDIDIVMQWRQDGKVLTKAEQIFAEKVADEMIALKTSKQVGVQLVEGSNLRYIKKGMQPVQGSDRAEATTQDVVSNVQRKSGKYPKNVDQLVGHDINKPTEVAEEDENEEAKSDVKQVQKEPGRFPRTDDERAKNHFNISDEDWGRLSQEEKKKYIEELPPRGTRRFGEREISSKVIKVIKPSGEKPKEVPISASDTGKEPRKSPDAQNIKLSPPDNQAEGAVTSVADAEENMVKQPEAGAKTKVPSEQIGHNPDEPMPRKMAEELISNANWGVEIGAYTNIKEGIERQLGRKSYAEFVDTTDKMKAVTSYLTSIAKEVEPTPIA